MFSNNPGTTKPQACCELEAAGTSLSTAKLLKLSPKMDSSLTGIRSCPHESSQMPSGDTFFWSNETKIELVTGDNDICLEG